MTPPIQGSFDAIVSLGTACQVAWQMKRKGLRLFSGPFDWFVAQSLTRITSLFQNRFADFMDFDHLRVEGQHGECLKVRDVVYDCLSLHDFPLACNTPEHLASYPEFKAKMKRRSDRLLSLLADKNRCVLFIRMYGQLADIHCYNHIVHEFRQFQAMLGEMAQFQCTILALTETTQPEFLGKDWCLENLYQGQIPPSNDRWEGCDQAWEAILSAVRLKN